MTESMVLQIETRGFPESRAIELIWDSVRIGQSAQCEIVVSDPTIADVACILRLRGETWYLQPLATNGQVSIDGRPISHLRVMPAGVSIRVGESLLTLQPRVSPVDARGSYEVPIPVLDSPSALQIQSDLDAQRRSNRFPEAAPSSSSSNAWARTPHVARPSRNLEPDPRRNWSADSASARAWEVRWRSAIADRSQRGFSPSPVNRAPGPIFDVVSPDEDDSTVTNGDEICESDTEEKLATEIYPESTCEAQAQTSLTDPSEIPLTAEIPPDATSCEPDVESGFEVNGDAPSESSIIKIRAHSSELDDSNFDLEVCTPLAREDHVQVDSAVTIESLPPDRIVSHPEVPALPDSSVWEPDDGPRPYASREPVLPNAEDLEWPSARVILASRSYSTPSSPAMPKPAAHIPEPTEPCLPSHWSPSLWVAWAPCTLVFLGIAWLGTILSWQWGEDSREAGVIADLLLRPGGPGPEGAAGAISSSDASWWTTTAGHLALKSAALGTSPTGDPESEERIRFLLGAARNASPLESSTRLARVEHGDISSDPLATIGLSRDTVSLALTARRLAREGKADASLRVYRQALILAAVAKIAPGQIPVYLEDRSPGRFGLPNEDLIVGIVREMASQTDWSYDRWSSALPDHALVMLATYRVLHERSAPEADLVLDRLIARKTDSSASPSVLEAAALAEGLALKNQYAEAADQYRDAIANLDDELIRRTWWLNLAEILSRGGDLERIPDALNAARAGRGDDAIGVIVGQAIARERLVDAPPATTSRSQGLRAN